MNKVKQKLVLLFVFISISINAQENISIVVLKGMAFTQNSKTESIKINRAKKMTIPTNSVVIFSKGTSAIIFNSNSKIEVESSNEKKLSYNEINTLLKKNKPSTLTKNFIAYLDKMYVDFEENNNSYGSSVGGVSRGIEDDALVYLPVDDSIILSDSLVLSFGSNETKLTSNIAVTNTNTNEVVYNEKPEINEVKLNGLKPGHYTWTYKFEYNGSKFTNQPPNTFIIPTSLEKASILKDIEDFKVNLNDCSKSETCLSDSTKELLLNDFLEKNKYYITK
jgi:hypothetical protein